MSDVPLETTNSAGAGFDYSRFPADVASEVRTAAERVRLAQVKTIAAILDTGRELLAVKQQLGHGHFGEWLSAEFGWGERTARNYMAAAERFGDKSEIVAVLQPATLYALASPSVSEEVREQALAQLSSGDLKPEDVGERVRKARDELADAKRAEATKRRRAKLPRKQLAEELAEERRREADEKRREEDLRRREKVHYEFVEMLRAELSVERKRWWARVTPDLPRYVNLQDLAKQVCAE